MADQDPNRALARLQRQNDDFREWMSGHETLRAALAAGQAPAAVVLGCADSRTTPERLFGTDLGELFVIRVAGNVADPSSIASAEYAVAHLGVRLIVVLAHERCGAVGAAIAGGDAGRNLNQLLAYIKPAIPDDGPVNADEVARRNARLQAERLVSDSEILRRAVAEDGLVIRTAFYHFSTGEVELDQDWIVAAREGPPRHRSDPAPDSPQ